MQLIYSDPARRALRIQMDLSLPERVDAVFAAFADLYPEFVARILDLSDFSTLNLGEESGDVPRNDDPESSSLPSSRGRNGAENRRGHHQQARQKPEKPWETWTFRT